MVEKSRSVTSFSSLFFLLLICSCAVCSIFLFAHGFLLSKQALSNITATEPALPLKSTAGRKRVLLLLVDALRYDFVAKVEQEQTDGPTPYYSNNLRNVHELLNRYPINSLLAKFIADPPTTTLQRLKALMTGSLPTFIDAGSNFAAPSVDEDNLMLQAASNNLNVTFMGDDTWAALFGRHFSKSFAFASFDVKDLDTVDNGIISHLLPEVRTSDWNFLVAHFLGVDHCGHRYGMHHPEMKRKLQQMNDVVGQVVSAMPSDAVLLVMGDHGMTATGDHGGDSADEVTSALFIYSPSVSIKQFKDASNAIAQIDIVPTIAALLGIPVPFSNIGMFIPQLLTTHEGLFTTLYWNGRQVLTYLKEYGHQTSDVALSHTLENLVVAFPEHTPQKDTRTTEERCIALESWFRTVRQKLELFWAKFDSVSLLMGIASLCDNCLWSLALLLQKDVRTRCKTDVLLVIIKTVTVPLQLSYILLGLSFSLNIVFLLTPVSLFGNAVRLSYLIYDRIFLQSLQFSLGFGLLSALVFGLYCIASFSNSFVVHENYVLLYVAASLLIINYVRSFTLVVCELHNPKQLVKKGASNDVVLHLMKSGLRLAFVLILLRLTLLFQRCREEDLWCQEPNLLTKPFWNLSSAAEKTIRCWIDCLSLVCIVAAPHVLMRRNGNLKGANAFEAVLQYCLPFATLCIFLHWATGWYLPDAFLKQNPQLLYGLPLCAYLSFLIAVIAFLYSPRCVTTVVHCPEQEKLLLKLQASKSEDVVPVLYQILRSRSSPKASAQHTYVFGLATAYSLSLFGLFSVFTTLLTLLLGDTQVVNVLLFVLTLVALLEFLNCVSLSPLEACFVWVVLTQLFFYTFGHVATFNAIPWHAAFIGIPGNCTMRWLQAIPVLMNLFASQILFAVSLPLVIYWRLYPQKTGCLSAVTVAGKIPVKKSMRSFEAIYTEAKLVSCDDSGAVLANVWRFCVVYFTALCLKFLCSMIASAILRRHLMVWKIFAPKFVFDGVGLMFSGCFVILSFCFSYRLHSSMTHMFSVVSATENISS